MSGDIHRFTGLRKIISGGQTGVDRAALDAAMELGIDHGGYCPNGRKAEDGVIPLKYNLIELQSFEYAERTLKNVQSANGTLILHTGKIIGGTTVTGDICQSEKKPLISLNLLDEFKKIRVNFYEWLEVNTISILNIAGPRESEVRIYTKARQVLTQLLSGSFL